MLHFLGHAFSFSLFQVRIHLRGISEASPGDETESIHSEVNLGSHGWGA